MQQATILQFPANPPLPLIVSDHTEPHNPGEETSDWILPGKLIILPFSVYIGVQYNETADGHEPELRVWSGTTRIANLRFDERNQIDLTGSIGVLITKLATRHDPESGLPMKTLIAIAHRRA